MRILFTGGGTGGHIYPIIAVAKELKEVELYYAGSAGNFEPLLSKNGIHTTKILSAKFRRYFDIQNLFDFFIFPFSIIQALWKVFWIMPNVLFSKSGPGSLPVVLACWFYRVPIIIHESDAIIGLANRLAMPFASAIALSWKSAAQNLLESTKNQNQQKKLKNKIAVTGNPIRNLESALQSILGTSPNKSEVKIKLGFDKNLPLILILGGSQGAVKINDFTLNIAGDLIKKKIQVFHQTGEVNFKEADSELKIILKNFTDKEKKYYQLTPYLENNLADAYKAADIIVTRSSGGVLFEIAAAGLPAILIPLPTKIVGMHQIKNAYEYAETGAAVVMEEENLSPHLFFVELEKILQSPEKLNTMSMAAKNFSRPDAAKIIAREIIALAK